MKNIAILIGLFLGIEPCYPAGTITTASGSGTITINAVGYTQDSAGSTSANSPATLADDSAIGTVVWNNPSNASSQNDTYAGSQPDGDLTITHYLKATDFGFSVPTGATINGIVVEVDKYSTASGGDEDVLDYRVRIVKGGTIGSTDKSSASEWSGTDTDTYITYGSSSDLWGETWTAADINGSTFGFAIAAQHTCGLCSVGVSDTTFIDHIRITVYYGATVSTQQITTTP